MYSNNVSINYCTVLINGCFKASSADILVFGFRSSKRCRRSYAESGIHPGRVVGTTFSTLEGGLRVDLALGCDDAGDVFGVLSHDVRLSVMRRRLFLWFGFSLVVGVVMRVFLSDDNGVLELSFLSCTHIALKFIAGNLTLLVISFPAKTMTFKML